MKNSENNVKDENEKNAKKEQIFMLIKKSEAENEAVYKAALEDAWVRMRAQEEAEAKVETDNQKKKIR